MLVTSFVDLLKFIEDNQFSMFAQLHQFCEINSGTYNAAGLNMMHQTLKSNYIPLADSIESIRFPPISSVAMDGTKEYHQCGDALLIKKRPHLKNRILLCGHLDTVYSQHSEFHTLRYLNDNHLIGPGVADMKGGLIIMLHALRAFEKTPFASQIGWDVFINADEEIGSAASKVFYEKISNVYQCALVYEPAMDEYGTLAKNRKGSGKFTLIAHGKAAHAGRAFNKGRNAICYLAEILLEINALNNQKEGLTINIGKISGGDALNVVPELAIAKLDIRINNADDQDWVQEQFQAITHRNKKAGYKLELEGGFGRPVKRIDTKTTNLFKRIQHIGEELGRKIAWKDSGGCSDGNNLAHFGIPVIDTLGARGGDIHSHNEYILLDSLVERTSLSALLLIDLAQGGLNQL
jgi:glutamate carboxypeptidase